MQNGGDQDRVAAGAVRLRPEPDVVSQRLGDAGVLIDMRSGRMFELNGTGVRVWELVGEGCSPESTLTRLQQEFAGDPDRLRAEVNELLDQLVREGLLHAERRD